MNTNQNNEHRQTYLDIAKGIGIILMIIGHSFGPQILIKIIYSFHMPLFFLISGYLFNEKKWSSLGIKKLIKYKLKAYIMPYFILCFINLILNMGIEFYIHKVPNIVYSSIRHCFYIIYSYSKSTHMPNCTPLWFLPCLFVCNIYMFLLLKIKKRYLYYILCCCIILFSNLLSYINIIQLPWHIDTALIGVIFMQIGLKAKKLNLFKTNAKIKPYTIILLSILGIISAKINTRIDMSSNNTGNIILFFISALSLSYVIIILCLQYIKDNKLITYIGKNTYIFLGLNYYFNTLLTICWKHIPKLNKLSLNWISTSLIIIVLCIYTNFIWTIFKRFFVSSYKNNFFIKRTSYTP